MSKLCELAEERIAEVFPMGGVQCAIAETMVRAVKGNDTGLAGGQRGSF